MTSVPTSFEISTKDLDPFVPQIGTSAPYTPRGRRRVLVTGAGGFLGVHLLARVLAGADFDEVFALVRQKAKVTENFIRYGLNPLLLSGVSFIEGDMNDLEPEAYPEVDLVIHSAARIHGLKSARHLWRDNVLATEKLFRRYAGAADIALVSTLSVFVSSNLAGKHLPESLRPSSTHKLRGGYAQTKYICERMANQVGARVIRLGLLTGSSNLGKFPESDFFTTVVQTLRELGTCPAAFVESFVDLTPVDLAAQQILAVVRSETAISHIANQESLGLSKLCQGLSLVKVPAVKFREQLSQLPTLKRMLMTYAFFKEEALSLYPEYFNLDLFQSTGHEYAIEAPFPLSNVELLSLYIEGI